MCLPEKFSSVRSVEKPTAEGLNGRRLLAWVVRHLDYPKSRDIQPVAKTGVILTYLFVIFLDHDGCYRRSVENLERLYTIEVPQVGCILHGLM